MVTTFPLITPESDQSIGWRYFFVIPSYAGSLADPRWVHMAHSPGQGLALVREAFSDAAGRCGLARRLSNWWSVVRHSGWRSGRGAVPVALSSAVPARSLLRSEMPFSVRPVHQALFEVLLDAGKAQRLDALRVFFTDPSGFYGCTVRAFYDAVWQLVCSQAAVFDRAQRTLRVFSTKDGMRDAASVYFLNPKQRGTSG